MLTTKEKNIISSPHLKVKQCVWRERRTNNLAAPQQGIENPVSGSLLAALWANQI